MADLSRARIWLEHSLFALAMLLLIFFRLLPLNSLPKSWAGPDLMLCITLAWTARRPDLVPVALVAAVFLLSDFLFQRPPGLWTALVLIATEMLRSRAALLRVIPFWLEWVWAAAAIVTVLLVYRFVLSVAVLPSPRLSLILIQAVATVAAYPIIVVLSHFLLNIRRTAPGEVDATGHRI